MDHDQRRRHRQRQRLGELQRRRQSRRHARTGTLTIGGKTFTVTQAGATCAPTIAPPRPTLPAAARHGQVTVTAATGCAWTATSNAAWITISAGATGSGNGSVTYAVAANTGTTSRTGTLTIGGNTFTVTQAGAPCTPTICTAVGERRGWPAGRHRHRHRGHRLRLDGDQQRGVDHDQCGRQRQRQRLRQLHRRGESQTTSRTGTLTIAGQTLHGHAGRVRPARRRWHRRPRVLGRPVRHGSVTVTAATGCGWTATSNAAWITITAGATGSGNGSVTYASPRILHHVAHRHPDHRRQTFTVTQAGATCAPTISPASANVAAAGVTAAVTVTDGHRLCLDGDE